MKTLLIFIATNLFLSVLTQAGVSSVGQGGGLTEMKFIYLFQNSNQWIQLCLDKNDLCSLSVEDKSVFKLLAEKNDWFNQFDILFKPDLASFYTETVVNERKTLTIKSNDLFDNDQPQNLSQILSRVLSVQSSLILPNVDLNQFINKFELILSTFRFDYQSFLYSAGQFEYKLHFFQTTKENKNLSLIFLEDNAKTLSLDEIFKLKYPLIDLHSLEVHHLQFSQMGDRYWIYGNISAKNSNGSTSIYKFIRISFKTNVFGLINIDEISVQLGIK